MEAPQGRGGAGWLRAPRWTDVAPRGSREVNSWSLAGAGRDGAARHRSAAVGCLSSTLHPTRDGRGLHWQRWLVRVGGLSLLDRIDL